MPVFAADYPLLDVFWTMLIFVAWVVWFMLLFRIFGDVFRRQDIGGGKKAAWLVFVCFLPFLGVFVYLIAQGSEMTERSLQDAAASRQQFDEYVKTVAADSGGDSPADQIGKAKQLLDSGTITDVEFNAIKAKALA